MKIDKGRKVKLKIELAVAGGATLEKSVVEFIQGAGTMLPGLEKLLVGLEPGARKEGTLPAREAFGDPALHPVKKMSRAEFPADAKLKVGERFVAKGAEDHLNIILLVEKIDDQARTVEVRLVHPLADKDLKYSFEVLGVIDRTPPPVPAAALKLEEG